MQKNFSFKGLTRSGDNLSAADGECMELVNLRVADGCLSPIPVQFAETSLAAGYSDIFWHVGPEKLLCITNDGKGAVHIYDKDYSLVKNSSNGSAELYPQLSGVKKIEFIGNIAACITAETIYYLIFDSSRYRLLGERPPMPEFSITYESKVHSIVSDEEYSLTVSLGESNSGEIGWGEASKGYFDQCVDYLHSNGYYIDRTLFRYALRLFDGSYICHSPIMCVTDNKTMSGLGRDGSNFAYEAVSSGAGVSSSKYKVSVQGFLPSFTFRKVDLGVWKNIIVGIDVFTTGSICGHKVSNAGKTSRGVDTTGVERYVKKSAKEIMNEVSSASLFYRIAEFDINGKLVDSLKNVSLSSIALSPALGDDAGSLMMRGANYSYVFNSRLHLAGVNETFFKGYEGSFFLVPGMVEDKAEYALVATTLRTDKGEVVVKREYSRTFLLSADDDGRYLTPYIMYPDSRAVEMLFVIQVGNDIYRKAFALKQHPGLNIATYINAYGSGATVRIEGALSNGTEPTVYSAENVKYYFSSVPGRYTIVYKGGKGWYFGDVEFKLTEGPDGTGYHHLINSLNPADGDTVTIVIEAGDATEDIVDISNIALDDSWEKLTERETVEERNVCERRGNVLRVSAVDLPFNFPAKNTYTPSQEDIVAVCSNTMALSHGQFGQHPLLLFCKDGIWALSSDASGSVTYSAAHPLSRETCLNARAVCAVDAGVAFVGHRGLMLLRGSSLQELSLPLDSPSHLMQSLKDEKIFCKIAKISGVELSPCDASFKEYAAGAVVGYMADENEICVSNSSYGYSFIYSLAQRTWTKMNHSFLSFTNRYPHLLALSLTGVVVLHRDYASPAVPVLLITRPQLWGGKLPKRILQFMLHAAVKVPDGGKGLGCYILCSNDGVHFKLLGGCERVRDFNDIVLPFLPTQAYKYFVVALSGTVSADSRIVGAELSMVTSWENRLR